MDDDDAEPNQVAFQPAQQQLHDWSLDCDR
jgi:hypothetical protein